MQCPSTSLGGDKDELAGEPHIVLSGLHLFPRGKLNFLVLSICCLSRDRVQEMLPWLSGAASCDLVGTSLSQRPAVWSQLRPTWRHPSDARPPLSWLQNGDHNSPHTYLTGSLWKSRVIAYMDTFWKLKAYKYRAITAMPFCYKSKIVSEIAVTSAIIGHYLG